MLSQLHMLYGTRWVLTVMTTGKDMEGGSCGFFRQYSSICRTDQENRQKISMKTVHIKDNDRIH